MLCVSARAQLHRSSCMSTQFAIGEHTHQHKHTKSTHNIRRNNASVHTLAIPLSLSHCLPLLNSFSLCATAHPVAPKEVPATISAFRCLRALMLMPTLAQAVAASGSGSAAMAILGSSIYRNCTAVDRWFLWALSSPLLLWSQTRDCSAREATETGAESAIKEGGSLHSMVVYRETGPNKCRKNGDAIQKNLFIHFRHNAYEYQCVPVCVCRVTWGPFRYFGSILLRAKK